MTKFFEPAGKWIFWCQLYDSHSSGISQSEMCCNTASTSNLESFPVKSWQHGAEYTAGLVSLEQNVLVSFKSQTGNQANEMCFWSTTHMTTRRKCLSYKQDNFFDVWCSESITHWLADQKNINWQVCWLFKLRISEIMINFWCFIYPTISHLIKKI